MYRVEQLGWHYMKNFFIFQVHENYVRCHVFFFEGKFGGDEKNQIALIISGI